MAGQVSLTHEHNDALGRPAPWETKQDTVKVRITARGGRRPQVRYTAAVETPIERTHLASGTAVVGLGPAYHALVAAARARLAGPAEEAGAEPDAVLSRGGC